MDKNYPTNRSRFLASEPEIDVTQFRKTVLDVPYADESVNQTLDIWYPDEGEGPYPLVIIFHGGAFAAGHKRTHYIQSMCKPVTQGYAVATCEYRLMDEAIWPAPLYDGKAAVRFLRANAEKYNLDPNKFALWGNSAGGTVTQLMAVTPDDPEHDDLSMGAQASSKVHAAIAWYTMSELMSCEQFGTDIADIRTKTGAGKGMMPNDGVGTTSLFTQLLGYPPLLYPERTLTASPITYVTKDCPPMLLQHGTNDLIIDYHQAVYMKQKIDLICGEGRAQLDLFEGEPHGSQVIKGNENISHCIDWLDNIFWDGKNPYRKPLHDLKIVGQE